MTYWNSPSFKALQKSWYQRLEEEGFQDAEKVVGNDLVLRQNATHPYRRAGELDRDIKELYYSILSEHVQQTRFHNEVDQIILTCHADGKKVKDICFELEKIGQKRCRWTVCYTIRKYEMAWGLRVYTRRQLHQREK